MYFRDPSINIDETQYLFLLSPPRSGSTAIIKLLNTSPYTMLLHPKGEGMRLVPSVWDNNRWNPTKKINWQEVKKTWSTKVKKVHNLVDTVSLILEKSPPNIVRAKEIKNNFPTAKFIVLNRNPYANCSSIFYRENKEDQITNEDRELIFKNLAEKWVERSKYQIQNINDLDLISSFSYEDFCSTPVHFIYQIAKELREIKYCTLDQKVQVKDYPPSVIENMNDRQISKLEKSDIKVMSSVLEKHRHILDYFKYDLL